MLLAVYFVKIHSSDVSFIPKRQNSQAVPLKVIKFFKCKTGESFLQKSTNWNPLGLKYILQQIIVNNRYEQYIIISLYFKNNVFH